MASTWSPFGLPTELSRGRFMGHLDLYDSGSHRKPFIIFLYGIVESLLFFFDLYLEVRCVQGLSLWRNSSSEVNDELFKGYQRGNHQGKINEIVAGSFA